MNLYHVFPALTLATFLSVSGQLAQSSAAGHEHEQSHPSQTHGGVCKGFLILANGYAVMSSMSEMRTAHHMRKMSGHSHAGGDMSKAMKPGDKMAMKDHLMGLKHGQNIATKKGKLCVPVSGGKGLKWLATGEDPMMKIHARSLRGELTHSSRANEAMELSITRHGKPVEGAHVRLIARMPHHDRQMPGGHGLANDPDVKGVPAKAIGGGKYRVTTVDFPMGGAWLFEVRVEKDGKTSRAYFAGTVGE